MPTCARDGWTLESGEECARKWPDTFFIAPRRTRESLQPGTLVKLMFKACKSDGAEIATERMWVIVRQRIPGGYMGILNNSPYDEAYAGALEAGQEFPFAAEHIINYEDEDPLNEEQLREEPFKPWV